MRASCVLLGLGFAGCTGATGPAGAMGAMGDPGATGSQGAVGPFAPGAGTAGPANAVLTSDGSGSAAWSTSATLSALHVTGTGKAGFGTTAPTAKVDVATENTDVSLQASRFNNDSAAAAVNIVRALGTAATPLAVTASTNLFTLTALGHDGTGPQAAGQIAFAVDGTVATGVVPGRVTISTANAAGTMVERLRIDQYGHLIAPQTTSPTLSSCGTGGTITGNDISGTFTVGSGASSSSCTVSFAHTFAGTGFTPHCSVTEHEGVPYNYAVVLDAFVVNSVDPVGNPITGATFEYLCIGH
jgi:hypothetical protein